MRHVIIGAGAAGISAARTIREMRAEDEIIIISSDSDVYSRCMLHKYIGGERDLRGISFVEDNFFDKNKIIWLSGRKVTAINSHSKTIVAGEDNIEFDTLLIASGADSVIPPIGDLKNASNVFGLRHLDDAQKIKQLGSNASKIAVIGAGLVGLDAVYGLLDSKKEITVIEMGSEVLEMNVDKKIGETYRKYFEVEGCKFLLSKKVVDTSIDETGKIKELILESGEHIQCDLVIVAVGVRPAMDFIENSGIEVDRAIKVNERLETSQKNIFAAGDVNGLSAIWPNAVAQGKVAAKNMCGENCVYSDVFAQKNTINFFGLPTLSLGRINPLEDDTVLIRDDKKGYRKIIIAEGRLVGVILSKNISNSGFWQYLIKNEIDVSGKDLWKLSFADFISTDENGEYKWTVS